MTVTKLSMVYDADGGIVGELSYVIGKLGGRHCALCDITHNKVRRKAEFTDLTCSLEVPVEVLHRNEQPAELEEFTRGRLPLVVAHRDGEMEVLLDADDLDGFGGEVAPLAAAISAALGVSGG